MSLLVCALAFALTPVQADTSVHVSWELRATRASVALQQLSTLAKIPLTTSPQTANEVLVVSVKDVPLSDLMKRIAIATSGDWKPEAGGFRLIAATAVRNQEARLENQRRTVAITEAIQKRAAQIGKKVAPGDTQAAALAAVSGGEGPDQAAIIRLLQGIDKTAIASVEPNDRVVFATSPNRMQRPFGANAGDALGEFFTAHNAAVPAQQAAAEAAEKDPQLQAMPDFVKNLVEKGTKRIDDSSKSLLVVSRMPLLDTLQAELIVYNGKGEVAFSGQSMLQSDFMEAAIRSQLPGAAKPTAQTNETPIEFTPESKELLNAVKSLATPTTGGKIKISAEVRRRVFHPDTFDPLCFSATDRLLALAKKQAKPLVADVPDELIGSFLTSLFTTKGDTVEGFQRDLAEGKGASIVPDDTWLVVKPAKPEESRLKRTDRIALAKLMKAADEKGVATLDDVAAYAQTAESPMNGGVGQFYVMLFVPGWAGNGFSGMTDWNMLRLWGSLSPVGKNTLLNGGKIPLNGLSGDNALIEKILFGATARFEQVQSDSSKQQLPYWLSMLGSGAQDFRQEPTELMPNGIPGDGFIEAKVTDEPIASAVTQEGESVPNLAVIGPEELAVFQYFKEDSKFSQLANYMPTIGKVRLGHRVSYAFTFHVTPQTVMHQSLQDNSVPKDGEVVAIEDLPNDFKKRISDKKDEVKKSPLGALGAMMGAMGGARRP